MEQFRLVAQSTTAMLEEGPGGADFTLELFFRGRVHGEMTGHRGPLFITGEGRNRIS